MTDSSQYRIGNTTQAAHNLPEWTGGILVSAPEGAKLLAVSERTFHLLRRKPSFPQAVMLGPRAVRWIRSELIEYARNLPRIALLPEPPQLAARTVRKA